MTVQQYEKLTEEQKIFADLLVEILATLKKLTQDISRDLEETVGKE